MASAKEFDRSICFTFFGSYRKQIKQIEEQLGKEKAYEVQSAIIDYGLFEEEITDPYIKMLVGETTLELIDSSQNKREKGFKGEDLVKTKLVTDYYRDHPDASQNEIAEATGVSKGKVNKVLKKLKEEIGQNGHDGHVNNNNYTNTNNNTINNNSSDRDRDRLTDHSVIDADAGLANAQTKLAGARKELANARSVQKPEETTKKKTSSRELTHKEKVKIIKLFSEHINSKDIAKKTRLPVKLVDSAIDEYISNGYQFSDTQDIIIGFPTIDGNIYEFDIKNCSFEKNQTGLQELFDILINPDGDFKCIPSFVSDWIYETYHINVV